jgi:hypothetical protein
MPQPAGGTGDTYLKNGVVLGSECEFYGSNEEGGMAFAHEDGTVCYTRAVCSTAGS